MTQIDEPNLDEQIDKIIVKHNQYIDAVWQGKHQMYALPETHQQIKALISDQVAKARIEWLDEQISHLLQDIYPTDLFAEPTQADFDRINKYDANLHTRLHCDGIRHGLHILRREVRGLSARDELATLNGVTL